MEISLLLRFTLSWLLLLTRSLRKLCKCHIYLYFLFKKSEIMNWNQGNIMVSILGWNLMILTEFPRRTFLPCTTLCLVLFAAVMRSRWLSCCQMQEVACTLWTAVHGNDLSTWVWTVQQTERHILLCRERVFPMKCHPEEKQHSSSPGWLCLRLHGSAHGVHTHGQYTVDQERFKAKLINLFKRQAEIFWSSHSCSAL